MILNYIELKKETNGSKNHLKPCYPEVVNYKLPLHIVCYICLFPTIQSGHDLSTLIHVHVIGYIQIHNYHWIPNRDFASHDYYKQCNYFQMGCLTRSYGQAKCNMVKIFCISHLHHLNARALKILFYY